MSTALTATTLALAAFLLFLVEPLAARQLLPALGGSAQVWLAAVLFFQAALLAGYLLADRLARRSPRAQALALPLVALAGLATLPPAPPLGLLAGAHPSLRVAAALAASAGLPFLALSASGPLLQSWWARARGAPFRLYALSNAASLLGLLAYPAVLEPLLELASQARLWTAGYVLFCALLSAAAFRSLAPAAPVGGGAGLRAGAAPGGARAGEEPDASSARPPRRWAWLALPGCTSALLLAVTAHLTQNVAPIPLLWVLPLAAYLLSFVIAFEAQRPPRRLLWLPLLVAGLGVLARAASTVVTDHARRAIALELCAFLAVCTAAHGELVRERPGASGTTAFYLRVSLGSALGALFVVALAPLVFRTELELPVSIFVTGLACAALLWREPLAVRGWIPRTRVARTLSLVCLDLLAIQLAVGEARGRGALRWAGRSFYGALRVADDARSDEGIARVLFHGCTVHGQQFLAPAFAGRPAGYYGPGSGAGRTLRALQARKPALRVGVVGLGVGVLAAWCRPGDRFTFYELDPLVTAVAEQQFGFLRRCPQHEVLAGDARLTLQEQPPQGFDLLLLDAFSSDAIPLHLLTREAFDLYARHLAPGGQLLVHVSNRFLDLSPVLAIHGAALGLRAFYLEEYADFAHLTFPNRYLLLVPDEADARAPELTGADELRAVAPEPGRRQWTDAYANLIGLLN